MADSTCTNCGAPLQGRERYNCKKCRDEFAYSDSAADQRDLREDMEEFAGVEFDARLRHGDVTRFVALKKLW